MSKTRIFNLGLIIFIALGLVLGAGMLIYTHNLEKFTSQHEAIILGQDTFLPGETSSLRVVVRDSANAQPLPDSEIRLLLSPLDEGEAVTLYAGHTGAEGTADIAFTIPADAAPSQTLRIETRSALGSDWVERPVSVTRSVRLLLTTDKPIYQPGQMVHLRALALDDFSRQAAAGQELEFSIADGKGNKVFRQVKTTSEFGIAAADFQLASEVNLGDYKITASLAGISSEKTVEVKRYQLPKFAITLVPERPYYLPGETVRLDVVAAYFYGKPVAQAQVSLTGYTFDVERQDAFTAQGETNADGKLAFVFDMPDFIAGTELENGLGRFYVEARVIDQAAQEESSSLSLPVAQQKLIIEAVPESGVLRPGLENILYILVSTPDGAPVEAEHLELKRYLRQHLYRHYRVLRMTTKARRVVRALFEAMLGDIELMPPEHQDAARRMEAADALPGRARRFRESVGRDHCSRRQWAPDLRTIPVRRTTPVRDHRAVRPRIGRDARDRPGLSARRQRASLPPCRTTVPTRPDRAPCSPRRG